MLYTITEGDKSYELREYCMKGDLEAVKQLIQSLDGEANKIIDFRFPDSGRCCLHEAVVLGHYAIVKHFVLETSCSLHTKTMMGKATATHLAANNGQRKILFLLLTHGADPSGRDRFGNTPLHYASNRNSAKVLVDYGAKASACNWARQDVHKFKAQAPSKKKVERRNALTKPVAIPDVQVDTSKKDDLSLYLMAQSEIEYKEKKQKLLAQKLQRQSVIQLTRQRRLSFQK